MYKQISKNKDAKEMEIPFTMIPNFCLDTMAMRKPAENCVYFAIIRQTAGYMTEQGGRKKNALLSISRLVQLTGLSRQGVLNSRRNLFNDGWIMYKLFGGMSSYAIIDRHEEFKRKQESNELTDTSQQSLPDQSNELTDTSQQSGHIKESEIKTIKEIEINTPTLSQQLKELAEKNGLTYSINTREQNLFQNKLSMEMGLTNEQILEQANRFFEIVTRDKKQSWIHSFSFGFKFLQFNWDKIDAWHNANKSNVVKFPKYDMEELRKEGWI